MRALPKPRNFWPSLAAATLHEQVPSSADRRRTGSPARRPCANKLRTRPMTPLHWSSRRGLTSDVRGGARWAQPAWSRPLDRKVRLRAVLRGHRRRPSRCRRHGRFATAQAARSGACPCYPAPKAPPTLHAKAHLEPARVLGSALKGDCHASPWPLEPAAMPTNDRCPGARASCDSSGLHPDACGEHEPPKAQWIDSPSLQDLP